MSDKDITEALIGLGAREQEARFYLELVRRPELTAGDLHRLTGVNRQRTYALLNEMVNRGFCRERTGEKHRYYRALPPQQLLERLERELEQQRDRARRTYGLLEEIYSDNRSPEQSQDLVQEIRQPEQINAAFLRLNRETQSEILSFNRSPYAANDAGFHEEQLRVGDECLARGVHFRTLNMMEPEQLPWLYPAIKQLDARGDRDIRVCEYLPLKLFLFDRQKVMLALPVASSDSGMQCLVLDDPGVAQAFLMLFEMEWAKALSLEEWQRQFAYKPPSENGKERKSTAINLARQEHGDVK